jgi:hypothetical protein
MRRNAGWPPVELRLPSRLSPFDQRPQGMLECRRRAALMTDFVTYIPDQLRGIGPFTVRAMFGRPGLCQRGLFLGLIATGPR